MGDLIVVHPDFDGVWPFAAAHFHTFWPEAELIRPGHGDDRPLGEVVADAGPADRAEVADLAGSVTRLATLGMKVTVECLRKFGTLEEATFQAAYDRGLDEECRAYLAEAGVAVYDHPSEGFWSQSVAEFGLALTLCGLRRIPQLHREIIDSQSPWDYEPPGGRGRPGARGQQFGDDPAFASGTLAGKRVRIVGAGNIASRYASFASMLGADVASWDPYATEPGFHRAGARRVYHLDQLVSDAEVFAPMVPLTESTHGLVGGGHIDALPRGCLVVLVTRALICDMEAVRRRVLADELSLAADVWDVEPLPPGDPLLGRHNVVHTPHNAGRTIDANRAWVEKLVAQFRPR
ncbi:MAG: hydroxyacid dehydrogenase [Gemmatimonadetes bacterium]|nr:hydroxyacid dehydrogenase [Gemmatimonadota bacterium]